MDASQKWFDIFKHRRNRDCINGQLYFPGNEGRKDYQPLVLTYTFVPL